MEGTEMHKLSSLTLAALTAAGIVLAAAPALADHRPGNVVVVGGTVSQTGRYVEPGGRQFNGVKLYVDELNARGGLLGHKVELKIYDDKSDKRTAIELYEKLITEDKVDLILGPYGSPLTDPVANVMERYKQPFVVGNSGNPKIYERGRKYIFSGPQPIRRDRFKGAVHVAKKLGVKRIAIIAEVTSPLFFVAVQEWAKKLGLKAVLSERFPLKQTDFRALLRRIEASGAEAIISISAYSDTVAQVRQLRELNINVKMYSSSVAPSLPKFAEELGSTAEFVVGSSPWEPKAVLGHPGIAEFIEKYEKRHGVKPNYHAAGGYAAMQILVAAVKKVGSFDPEKIRNSLASIAVYSIRGPYRANERGVSAPTEPTSIQIQNGKRMIVWPEDKAEAKVLPMPKWEDRGRK